MLQNCRDNLFHSSAVRRNVMKRFGNLLTALAAIVFVISSTAAIAEAQRKNERQIRDQVRGLNAQIDDFQFGLDHQLRTSSLPAQDVEDVQESIRNLQTKVDDLDENLTNRRDNRDDIREIVTAANAIDAFLAQNPQNRRIGSNWQAIRTAINNLASNYSVTPDWGNSISTSTSSRVTVHPPVTPRKNSGAKTPPQISTPSYGLTGTYSLDAARSEKIADIISNSGVDSSQRSELALKLEAPDQIAIDIRGSEVTLASSKAPPVTFYADGREKMEESDGRSISVRATMRGEELTITSLGGETDYIVSFMPMVNGRGLRVTRRITTDYLKETIFAESFYNKTDASAGLGIDRTTNTGSYPR